MNRQNRLLLALLRDRRAFLAVSQFLSEDDFSDLLKIPVRLLTKYYDSDVNAPYVDLDWLRDAIVTMLPSPKHHEPVLVSLHTDQDVSIPNVVEEYLALKKEQAGKRLGRALLQADDQSALDALIEDYLITTQIQERKTDDTFIDPDLDMLLESVSADNLLRVIPTSLNDRLDGGLPEGTTVAIYAPTEVGKSLLSINMACGFMHDGHKVLYCGNEDAPKQMLLRFYARLSGMTKQEMAQNPSKARKAALDNGMSNLIFKAVSPGSVGEIRRLVEKHKPKALFIDQMANMETPTAFTKVERNEYLAAKLRSITQKNGLRTIIVHQASDSAYGKLILNKNDMYYSNVGVQGQMDVMIGIGADETSEATGMRMLCLTKNKISSNHENFPVFVEPLTSKVRNA